MKKTTVKNIIKALDCEYLNLYRGKGYYYFTYSYEKNNIFETYMVYVPYLNRMSFDAWVEEGKLFIRDIKESR